MLKCAICGYEVKYRLIEHILSKHKTIITLEEYKLKYGNVITEEYRLHCIMKGKEKWGDPEYVKKTMDSRQEFYNDPEHWKKVGKGVKQFYINGGSTWNKGKTKEEDLRLVSIGEKNRQHLTGRTKETHENIKRQSERMKELWKQQDSSMTYNTKWMSPEEQCEWKTKISKGVCDYFEKNGYTPVYNGYVQGWYERNDGNKEWYCSSYERDFMIFLDDNNITWTTKHNIRLKYIYENVERNYIPDFKIVIDDVVYIIELKGWLKEKDKEKIIVGKQTYGENYFVCYSVNEAKEIINELIKG